MAKSVKVRRDAKKKKSDSSPTYMVIDRLFRIAPVKKKARGDASRVVIVEHRIGKDAGAYTRPRLMDRTGLEQEWLDTMTKMEKKYRDRKRFETLSDVVYSGQKAKLSSWLRSWKQYIVRFYENQGLKPLASFVPINDSEWGIYIQALIDIDSRDLVVGDTMDYALYAESVYSATRGVAIMNRECIQMAKTIMKLPGVNKDIQNRMNLVAKKQLKGRPHMLTE